MVRIAKYSGFCFGVNRAVEMVEKLLRDGKKVQIYGEIIHNKQVCEDLKRKGVRVVYDVNDINVFIEKNLVIRSHGVGPQVYVDCKKLGVNLFDATCPFVKRIHRIVQQQSLQGKTILIAGDENHSEVQALKKYCHYGRVFVFSDFGLIEKLLQNSSEQQFVLVAQTTFNSVLWCEGLKKIERFCSTNLQVFNTICSATMNRQLESVNLAKEVDLMVVIGGKNSSNSKKLFELCSQFCSSVFVEDVYELKIYLQKNKFPSNIGITAGASTPKETICEIFEMLRQQVG